VTGTALKRPRRSDRTRARILAAARARFAGDGYERTTIRAVAREAAIDPSMVMRYFGSKEGLFAAAAEVELRLPNIRGIPKTRIGVALVAHFFELWDGDDDSLQILLRTSASNEEAAERARVLVRDQIATMVARVRGKRARVLPLRPSPPRPSGHAARVTRQIDRRDDSALPRLAAAVATR